MDRAIERATSDSGLSSRDPGRGTGGLSAPGPRRMVRPRARPQLPARSRLQPSPAGRALAILAGGPAARTRRAGLLPGPAVRGRSAVRGVAAGVDRRARRDGRRAGGHLQLARLPAVVPLRRRPTLRRCPTRPQASAWTTSTVHRCARARALAYGSSAATPIRTTRAARNSSTPRPSTLLSMSSPAPGTSGRSRAMGRGRHWRRGAWIPRGASGPTSPSGPPRGARVGLGPVAPLPARDARRR